MPSQAEIELLLTIFHSFVFFLVGGGREAITLHQAEINLNKTTRFKGYKQIIFTQGSVFPLGCYDTHGETHQRPLRGARFASKAAAGSPAEPHRAVAKSPDCH